MTSNYRITALLFVSLLASATAFGGAHGPRSTVENTDVPLFDDLGTLHHAVTTASPEAQAYFDQGLRLIYAFNHDEAILAFKESLKRDPNCAMAYWGIAAAKGPNYNLGMDAERTKASFEASRKAQALAEKVSQPERDYIAAMTLRYSDDPTADRATLDRAYSEAMRALAAKYPNDDDALTLYAESMMNLRPWQLWNKDGSPAPGTPDLLRALETVLARNPNHPGAIHYYIHSTEASPNPEKAEPYADKLGALVPGAGHLVHMPAHTYIRVGRYDEAVRINVQAADIDRAYIAFRNPQGVYPYMYFPHNVHFIWCCSAIEGKSKLAESAARELMRTVPMEVIKTMPMAEFAAPTPYFAHVRFGHWKEMLEEPRPPQELQYTMGMWHYARGIALAGQGKPDFAKSELDQLVAIRDAIPEDRDIGLNKAKAILTLASTVLDGDIARKRGDLSASVAAFTKAVEMEDAMNYEEPPAWYQPVRLLLGAALLDAKQPAEAETIYRKHLAIHPKDGWALFGLTQSLTAQGRKAEARDARKQFKTAWKHADVKLKSSRF